MRSQVNIPLVVRGVFIALLAVVALSGPAGLSIREQNAEAAFLFELKKLLASDAQIGDSFGWSVAISGDIAIVAAVEHVAAVPGRGVAYVYQRGHGGAENWGEVKKLIDSDPGLGDRFGRSVAVSGSTAVVGTGSGAVIFERDQGGADNWGEVKKITGSDVLFFDGFGYSVAISGDTTVVGAPSLSSAGDGRGAAYVFERDEGGADNWGEVKKLAASDAEDQNFLGISVAVSGDTAVAGALTEYTGAFAAGAAYVYRRDQGGAGNWGEVKKLTASDTQPLDYFGISVAAGGDTLVIGAVFEDEGGDRAGAAYVFQRNQGGTNNWGETKKLLALDAEPLDSFGRKVAVSGDVAIVGAPGEDGVGSNSGAAYVFARDHGGAGNWGETRKLIAGDPEEDGRFGSGVGISGGTVLVGAVNEDAAAPDAGAAYIFQESPKQPAPGDTDEDGCSDQAESGQDAQFGGLRSHKDFWDFYDVWTHPSGQPLLWERNSVVNIFDILAVGLRFGSGEPVDKLAAVVAALTEPVDETGYHTAFDRGPVIGPNNWNRAPADGGINMVDDVLGVALQFGHTCA